MMPKPKIPVRKTARSGDMGFGLPVFLFLLAVSTVLGIAVAVTNNTLCAPGDYNEANDSWQS